MRPSKSERRMAVAFLRYLAETDKPTISARSSASLGFPLRDRQTRQIAEWRSSDVDLINERGIRDPDLEKIVTVGDIIEIVHSIAPSRGRR